MPFKLRGALKDIEIALVVITTLAFYLVHVTVVQQQATRIKIKIKKKTGTRRSDDDNIYATLQVT